MNKEYQEATNEYLKVCNILLFYLSRSLQCLQNAKGKGIWGEFAIEARPLVLVIEGFEDMR